MSSFWCSMFIFVPKFSFDLIALQITRAPQSELTSFSSLEPFHWLLSFNLHPPPPLHSPGQEVDDDWQMMIYGIQKDVIHRLCKGGYLATMISETPDIVIYPKDQSVMFSNKIFQIPFESSDVERFSLIWIPLRKAESAWLTILSGGRSTFSDDQHDDDLR